MILLIKVFFNYNFCIFVFFFTFMGVSDDGFIKMPKPEALILANNQLDALLRVFIHSFHLCTCFEHQVLIIRRSNCINTSSGMISLCDCLVCRSTGIPSSHLHIKQSLTHEVLIIRRSNCINTSSGMISLCDCLVCRSTGIPSSHLHIKQSLTHQVLIIRRSNCINTSSGMISLCK